MENSTAKDKIVKELVKKFDSGKIITILEGQAPEQHNPTPVDISGTITSVSRFIEKRKEEFDPLKAHCRVSKSDGVMTLITNEQTIVDKYTIQGKVYLGKRFQDLGINDLKKSYSPKELANKFRLLRSIFKTRSEHTEIVSLLRNIKAKINSDIDKKDDARGNVTVDFKQALETNIPKSFNLTLPLLEGEEPTVIEVAVVIEIENGTNLVCSLESIDGADMIEELKDKLISEEVSKIEEHCTVIYY